MNYCGTYGAFSANVREVFPITSVLQLGLTRLFAEMLEWPAGSRPGSAPMISCSRSDHLERRPTCANEKKKNQKHASKAFLSRQGIWESWWRILNWNLYRFQQSLGIVQEKFNFSYSNQKQWQALTIDNKIKWIVRKIRGMNLSSMWIGHTGGHRQNNIFIMKLPSLRPRFLCDYMQCEEPAGWWPPE